MANIYKRCLCDESLKTHSSRPILIYFECRSTLNSPKKFIATKYCFLIRGDDTSFFFFLCLFVSIFFVFMLCYVIFFYYKFLQWIVFYLLFFLLLFIIINIIIYLINYFFIKKYFNFFMFRDVPGCSGMFRNVPGCSMFLVLSTPQNTTVLCIVYVVVQPNLDLDRFIVFTHWSEMWGKAVHNI